ncbi:Protein of unknown function [Acinetobacter marinus]|uniref:DUF4031 domain-containing protein n=1 Tax=Acinetobacter marinus TaxID=281375 RepID=A0A1G6NXQ1_9GAMM|nr:DUF4031 domain-containing protein [Acinetobacter marinus]SDC71945.1 Protein of unknown function [Acinetobacter marinus]
MTIYVDNMRIKYKGKEWCHLMADSLDELHEFALFLGLHRGWFHRSASYPHYDVTVEVRAKAIIHGALPAQRKTIIECGKKLKRELLASTSSDLS